MLRLYKTLEKFYCPLSLPFFSRNSHYNLTKVQRFLNGIVKEVKGKEEVDLEIRVKKTFIQESKDKVMGVACTKALEIKEKGIKNKSHFRGKLNSMC